MTRRIVDLKDVNTQELVYPATHSDAVLMPDGKTVTEAIANAGGGTATAFGSTQIDVTTSGEYALAKNVVNYANLNITDDDKQCSFSFADAPTYADIIAGGWAEYKLYFLYNSTSISFSAGVIWAESCGTPIFEAGYIYEFSFIPFVASGKMIWLGLWSCAPEKNVITIEFAYDSNYEVYTLTANKPIASPIIFVFYNGLQLSMSAGESYIEISATNLTLPAMHLNDLSGDTVYDDYNIYKLVDKT